MRPRLTGPSQCTTCTTGTSLQGHGHPNMCPGRHPKSRPTFLNLVNYHPVLQHGRPSDERLPTDVAKVGRGLALVPPHVDLVKRDALKRLAAVAAGVLDHCGRRLSPGVDQEVPAEVVFPGEEPAPADGARVDRLGGVPAAVVRVRQVSLGLHPAAELALAVGADLGEVGRGPLDEGVGVEVAGEHLEAAGERLVAVGASERPRLAF